MKKILIIPAIMCCLCELQAIDFDYYDNNLFGILSKKIDPKFVESKRELSDAVFAIYKSIMPEDESKKWTEKVGKFGIAVDDEGCWREWNKSNRLIEDLYESIKISYVYKLYTENKVKRNFKDIEEYFNLLKKGILSKYEGALKKISEKDGTVEIHHSLENSIRREVLFGDWLISMEYKLQIDSRKKNQKNWEENRDLWVERFKTVHFGQ
jgi:hypothetical protein